jgi:SAM-dependent methyltransferase
MSADPGRAIWHEVECGAYEADLALWEDLAASVEGEILELGCGTGRVARRLADRLARPVTGLDSDPALIAALGERPQPLLQGTLGDARDFDLGREFGLILAPMQLIQLLRGREERLGALGAIAAHLESGGIAALAIVEDLEAVPARNGTPPLPDVREVDGWVYSSQPLDVVADGEAFVVRRLRQAVAPGGTLSEAVDEIELRQLSAEALEREAAEVGLRPAGRREIPATEAHVGSKVIVLEGAA